MDTIKDILSSYRKPVPTNGSKRGINIKYETALQFAKYVGLPVLVVLRLFKIYGMNETLSIRGWLYDVPHDPSRGGKIALAHWKLKQLREKKVGSTAPSKLNPSPVISRASF